MPGYRKPRIGYTLLWAITASNTIVVFENAETFFIILIITITASSKIIAWVMLLLFILQRWANGKYHPCGTHYHRLIMLLSRSGAPGDHSIQSVHVNNTLRSIKTPIHFPRVSILNLSEGLEHSNFGMAVVRINYLVLLKALRAIKQFSIRIIIKPQKKLPATARVSAFSLGPLCVSSILYGYYCIHSDTAH